MQKYIITLRLGSEHIVLRIHEHFLSLHVFFAGSQLMDLLCCLANMWESGATNSMN